MSDKSVETKLAQYHEFFSIEHDFSINITPLEQAESINFDLFLSNMPMPFKMASEVITIDQAALRPLQGLSNVAGQLVDFLQHQSQKIDLLVSYILSQQDEEKHRYQGISFGGGGVCFSSTKTFEVGKILEMKIFLLQNNCAVYCYSEVIEIEEDKENNTFLHRAIFHFIREEDREILVRTSLHEQSKQLQQLAKKRNSANN